MDIENGGSVENSGFQPGGGLLFSRDCKSFWQKYSYSLLYFIFLMELLFVV